MLMFLWQHVEDDNTYWYILVLWSWCSAGILIPTSSHLIITCCWVWSLVETNTTGIPRVFQCWTSGREVSFRSQISRYWFAASLLKLKFCVALGLRRYLWHFFWDFWFSVIYLVYFSVTYSWSCCIYTA